MNPCKYCGANATIHLTDIVNKKRREIHLCEKCAQEHELLPLAPNPQLNLPALLQLLMLQIVIMPEQIEWIVAVELGAQISAE